MVTRLYLGRETPLASLTPTPDAGWEKTTGFFRAIATKQKGTTAMATTTIAAQGTTGNDTLLGQHISPPLDSNQTVGGVGATVKGQVRVSESNAALDGRAQCLIWVMKPDLSSRGTVLAMDTAALANEYVTALTNRKVPRGGAIALSSVSALTGDRIVIETGGRQHATNSSNFAGSYGDAVTDLAEDETTTTANAPWVEFSETFTFSIFQRVSQVVAETLYKPDDSDVKARITSVITEVLYSPGPATPRTHVRWID